MGDDEDRVFREITGNVAGVPDLGDLGEAKRIARVALQDAINVVEIHRWLEALSLTGAHADAETDAAAWPATLALIRMTRASVETLDYELGRAEAAFARVDELQGAKR